MDSRCISNVERGPSKPRCVSGRTKREGKRVVAGSYFPGRGERGGWPRNGRSILVPVYADAHMHT